MSERPEKEMEIGRIVRPNAPDLVVRIAVWKEEKWIDVRNWIKTPRYVGFSKAGMAVKEEELKQIIDLLRKASETKFE